MASNPEESLEYRLRARAAIRRSIKTRKSVQEGAPDRIADLLEEAAEEVVRLEGMRERLKLARDKFTEIRKLAVGSRAAELSMAGRALLEAVIEELK